MKNLLIICGQEGAGKSTLAKAIVPHLKNGAAFDAENILQVNPFEFDENFQSLALENSLDLIHNFFEGGYENVVAGSFLIDQTHFDAFKAKLKYAPKIYILMLTVEKGTRDERRLNRDKKTTKEWMDLVDSKFYLETSLRDKADESYTYFEIDNTKLNVADTIELLKQKIPQFFT
ncbi:MAG: hypothetical protein PHV93_04150 [Candidatus Pacebacteria bacterium]|nr:hypothetical protein [Candidatus Paceibacterota bacterium]